MPDISMCADDECSARHRCYRNKASGTKPSEPWQTFAAFQRNLNAERCANFWPVVRPKKVSLALK